MITFKVNDLKKMNSELKIFLDFLESADIADQDIFDSRLVSCELITNVIRHCGDTAVFEGQIAGDCIKISVKGEGGERFKINPSLPDVFAESGRGLYIVQCICYGDIETEEGAVKVLIKLHGKEGEQ